jgi:hypothetical protein
MTALYAACRCTLTWLLATSPAWFRIVLAWLLAEVTAPVAHLVMTGAFHAGPSTNPSVIVPRFLAVLVIWLPVCLAILVRRLYDLSRAFFPRRVAILVCPVLSGAHVWAFFRISELV